MDKRRSGLAVALHRHIGPASPWRPHTACFQSLPPGLCRSSAGRAPACRQSMHVSMASPPHLPVGSALPDRSSLRCRGTVTFPCLQPAVTIDKQALAQPGRGHGHFSVPAARRQACLAKWSIFCELAAIVIFLCIMRDFGGHPDGNFGNYSQRAAGQSPKQQSNCKQDYCSRGCQIKIIREKYS